ncbi:MAG: cardiolipin synthase [Defluviitaleaceae bacterium]|nr:cardiolipin synthase [Defluviitaleaceae bacterium]
MKLIKKISPRLGIIILLLILQIAVFMGLAGFILFRFPLVSYIGYFISFLVFLFLLKKEEASAYKMTWIIIVLLLPSVGGAIYLLYGKEHRARRKIVAHVKEHALIAKLLDSDENLPDANQIQCTRMFSLMQYVRGNSSYHAYKNTQSKYYSLGELMFDDMLAELMKAEKFIFLEYFIISKSEMWNRLLEVLEHKASQGVEVRLIIDDFGSQKLFTNAYITMLRSKNIYVLRFNPLIPFVFAFMNNRDHRKILVVDGHVAFVGGINISDDYINTTKRLGVWKDTGLCIKGDGVWSFTLMFIEMWDTFCKAEERITDYEIYRQPTAEAIETDGFVLPYGDSPLDHDRLGENIYVDILNQAVDYVYIFTPYLIISEKMTHALQMAAKRGVDVRIVTPGIPDKKIVFRLTRSYYNALLEAGVRIFEYTPGFLHGKSFVCDDKIGVVGTINLDYRSLYLHFECAALLYNSSSVMDLKEDCLKTLAESREILLKKRRFRPLLALLDALLHLFAPLM